MILAREGDSLVGSVVVCDDGHRGWMYYLAVADDSRRRGIGSALVIAAEQWLRERGQSPVRLMVRTDNLPTVAFYAALGYADQECVVLGRTMEATTNEGARMPL